MACNQSNHGHNFSILVVCRKRSGTVRARSIKMTVGHPFLSHLECTATQGTFGLASASRLVRSVPSIHQVCSTWARSPSTVRCPIPSRIGLAQTAHVHTNPSGGAVLRSSSLFASTPDGSPASPSDVCKTCDACTHAGPDHTSIVVMSSVDGAGPCSPFTRHSWMIASLKRSASKGLSVIKDGSPQQCHQSPRSSASITAAIAANEMIRDRGLGSGAWLSPQKPSRVAMPASMRSLSASSPFFRALLSGSRLEELDDVARGVLDEDLTSTGSTHDLVAEAHTRVL